MPSRSSSNCIAQCYGYGRPASIAILQCGPQNKTSGLTVSTLNTLKYPLIPLVILNSEFQNQNMEFYASGKKTFYQPQSSYQANIDAGLLAHVREEVFRREEEQKKQLERKSQDEKRSNLARQIQSMVTNLPMYVKENVLSK